jgi:putative oxidoreductase
MVTAELQPLLRTRERPAARWAAVVRWCAGAVFVVFGIGKFSDHAHEASSFAAYGLPSPDAFVYLVGVLEVVGGLLLILGLLTRLVALALAGNMVGAIIVSGIGEGEVLPSLTLAPLLLAAMLYLLWVGPGDRAVDGRLLARLTPVEGKPR